MIRSRLTGWLCSRVPTADVDDSGRRSPTGGVDVHENGRHPRVLGNGASADATCARSQRFCPDAGLGGRRRPPISHRSAVRSREQPAREVPPELLSKRLLCDVNRANRAIITPGRRQLSVWADGGYQNSVVQHGASGGREPQAPCDAAEWGYRVVGEVRPVRMANIRWLAGYRHPRCGADEGLVARLLALLSMPSPLVTQVALLGDPIAVLSDVPSAVVGAPGSGSIATTVGRHAGVASGDPVSGRPGPRAVVGRGLGAPG